MSLSAVPAVLAVPALALAVLLAAAAATSSLGSSTSLARQDPAELNEVPVETRSFSLPNTRLVLALHASAERHLEARRWSEALTDLQRILEDHSGDLLGGERPQNTLGHASDQPVHPGAAHRVRERLFELPAEARELYVQRHGREARAAFDAARTRGDAAALIEVARRWPLTPAATGAWWALGDLEHEAGRPSEAAYAWARATAFALGDLRAAPSDASGWNLARERLAARGPLDAGVAARIQAAVALASDQVLGAEDLARGLRLPGCGEAAGPPPGLENDAWPESFRLPWHPMQRAPRGDGLFAAKAGDRLFVSTGLRLVCLSAFGGELLWDSGEPAGWAALNDNERDDRFLGIDHEAALLAPAASDDVVVAALQVPYIRLQFQQFQRIDITRPIPERRLFAFDAHTGRPLWSHAPPILWDGESGELSERLIAAGPPVIVGRRVIAPLVRMEGRIGLHVACFDLDTGATIWSTAVISGQRELNMFNRAEHEFCAPPVRVEGDRVVVLTQLGSIAALDLFSGEILWETLYQQIALPKTREFRAAQRVTPWRNCPPVVCDGTVLAVPYDSEMLVALDLETGALAWERSTRQIHVDARAVRGSVDLLLGVEGRTIYLGGDRIVALESPGGLGSGQRMRARWTWPDDDEARYRVGRPALLGDRVVVPFDSERIELAREDGRILGRIPWPASGGGGNLLSVPGELYTTSPLQVRGVFEWTALLARARMALEASPRDADRALALARLLAGRAAADWARGQGEPARARFAESRAVLERALAGQGVEGRAAMAAELVNALRGEARVRAQLADSTGALELLRRAREMAHDPAQARDVILDQIALLRARGTAERAAVLAALDDLERTSALESLPVEITDLRDGSQLALRVTFAPIPRGAVFEGGAVFKGGAVLEGRAAEIPVGLWVLFERSMAHAASADSAAEFADLHSILERHGDVELPTGTAGELATERILALLASGQSHGYEPFEARARTALESARTGRDAAALARVARQHPGSQAARDANDALLTLALERGDVAAVAGILAAELPDEVGGVPLDDRAGRLLLHLAGAARRSGNRALSAELVRLLAEARPELVPDVPGFASLPLHQIAAAEPVFEPWPGTSEVGRFDGQFGRECDVLPGEFEVLGIALADTALSDVAAGAPREMVVLKTQRERDGKSPELRLLGSDDPCTPRWSTEIPIASMPKVAGPTPWLRRAAFAPGCILLALSEEVLAIDVATGDVRWRHRPDGDVESLWVVCASGVAVVSLAVRDERPRLVGLDASGGAVLWDATLSTTGGQRAPLVSERHVVLLPASGQTRGSVRDLFTGRTITHFELPTPAVGRVDQEAWVERGLLVVPWLDEMRLPARNHVVALDLERGSLAWRLPFDSAQRRMLTGVVQQGDHTWLRIGTVPGAIDEDPLPAPTLAELSVAIGAAAPLDAVRLASEDIIIGLMQNTRVRLPEGPLLVLSPRISRDGAPREARLRAIDPARGELWVQGLQRSFDDVRTAGVQAAWSERSVVVAIPLYDGKQKPPSLTTLLQVYDRETGLFHDQRQIVRTDRGEHLQLHAFGETLLVKRPKSLEILR